jgi:parvulin-like peptidyl-prolyl isomerase
MTERDLEDVFGPVFASTAVQLAADTWSEPIASSYGLHIVRVTARDVRHRPTVDEVRSALARDWRTERRADAGRAALARLRTGYDVRIEGNP